MVWDIIRVNKPVWKHHYCIVKCRQMGLVHSCSLRNPTSTPFCCFFNVKLLSATKKYNQNQTKGLKDGVEVVYSEPLYLFPLLSMPMWVRMQVSERESERERDRESKDPGTPHPLSDHTSSRCPSLFSGSAPGGGCWASGLSDSASTSVTAAALGSDTSLQDPIHIGEWGRWECRTWKYHRH